ncbi:MAG: glycosyltransferase family 4 protein, partial [Ilumatobacteraceae bacterium]
MAKFFHRIRSNTSPYASGPLRVLFVMEQQIGHRTYSQNLKAAVELLDFVDATWVAVTYEEHGGVIERIPLPSGVRGALRGRRQIRRALSADDVDAVLFFTQVPAVLAGRKGRSRPYFIVLDDTPILFDEMSEHYGQRRDRIAPLRWFKQLANRRTLQAAAAVLPFSAWAARSLVEDYGVDRARVEIIPPGVDTREWYPRTGSVADRFRVLFVGGDFSRKGGPTLLRALTRLNVGSWSADIVTRSPVPPTPGVTVHTDMEPNSSALRSLFRESDVLVMPSLAEAFGHVVVEAAASGLPAIVSDVGGMPEIVEPEKTGFVVQPDDDEAIREFLQRLIDD